VNLTHIARGRIRVLLGIKHKGHEEHKGFSFVFLSDLCGKEL